MAKRQPVDWSTRNRRIFACWLNRSEPEESRVRRVLEEWLGEYRSRYGDEGDAFKAILMTLVVEREDGPAPITLPSERRMLAAVQDRLHTMEQLLRDLHEREPVIVAQAVERIRPSAEIDESFVAGFAADFGNTDGRRE